MTRTRSIAIAAAAALLLGLAEAAPAGEAELTPVFKPGEKVVEARQDGKEVWKVQLGFEVGGVIGDSEYWIIFSKDETTVAMVHGASGKMIMQRAMRGPQLDAIRKQAAADIDSYLKSLAPVQAGPDVEARVAELIKDLGATEFEKREKASRELVGIGKPALAALKEARKSSDPEVASRAEAAAAEVAGGEAIEKLRAASFYARMAVYSEQQAALKKAAEAEAALAAAEKSGDGDAASRLRTELAAARGRAEALATLQKKLGESTTGAATWGMGVGGGVFVK